MKGLACTVVLVVACCFGCVCGICVLDNKKGWSLECGVRDSYLFRVKDYGGIRANFDFGFELGNEKGFPLSITNTKKGGYHRRQDDTARSSNMALEAPPVGKRQDGHGVRATNSWPLPQDLRPPPPVSQSLPERGTPVYQVPAQRRHVVGPFSMEKVRVGQPSVERGVPGQAVTESNAPFVHSPVEKGDTATPVSLEIRPVIEASLERRPVYQSSLGEGGPIAQNLAERRTTSDQIINRPRPSFSPQRTRKRSRNSRRPSRAQSFLSWLPWPFSYFVSSPDPIPAPAEPVQAFPNKRSHTNFRVFHEDDLQQGFSVPQQDFGVPQLPSPLAPPPALHHPQPQPHFQPHPPHRQTSTQPPPTVDPEIAQILKVQWDTPADTDHVPSFAARMFVVREAPKDYHPPGYTPSPGELTGERVEVPRTKFFCEEQKYLPGIYADTQLGCKVFHLCVPAAMGNTLTSFLCPNMTLFDQSVLQCNWWFHVSCEESSRHFDANLPLAISYRKINSALLPLSAVNNLNSVSLLAHNTNGFVSRISRAMDFSEEETDPETIEGEGITVEEDEGGESRSESEHITDSLLTFPAPDISPDQTAILKRFYKLLEVVQND